MKADRRKIEVFETWCWRRTLKIFGIEKMPNGQFWERRKKWLGYLLRNNTWITSIIEGKVEKKSGKGRLRQSYIK